MTGGYHSCLSTIAPKILTRVIGCYDSIRLDSEMNSVPKILTRVIGCYDLNVPMRNSPSSQDPDPSDRVL